MTPQDKQEISDHLREAMEREELHAREAGKFLNMNPIYVSMARNTKHFNAMSKENVPEEEEESSPDNILPVPEKPQKTRGKKEKPGKSVKLIINQQEMIELRQKISFLEEENDKLRKAMSFLSAGLKPMLKPGSFMHFSECIRESC